MEPTLVGGEFVLLGKPKALKVGDIVVIKHPVAPLRLAKRLHSIEHANNCCQVRSDNPNAGQDSRHFGTVPIANIEGVVTLNLSNPARSLQLRR